MIIVSQDGNRIYNFEKITSVYIKFVNVALSMDKRKYYVMAEIPGQDDRAIAEYSTREQAADAIHKMAIDAIGQRVPYVMPEDKE